MKLAWLVWCYEDDVVPVLITGDMEDQHWKLDACWRKVRIVYTEVTE